MPSGRPPRGPRRPAPARRRAPAQTYFLHSLSLTAWTHREAESEGSFAGRLVLPRMKSCQGSVGAQGDKIDLLSTDSPLLYGQSNRLSCAVQGNSSAFSQGNSSRLLIAPGNQLSLPHDQVHMSRASFTSNMSSASFMWAQEVIGLDHVERRRRVVRLSELAHERGLRDGARRARDGAGRARDGGRAGAAREAARASSLSVNSTGSSFVFIATTATVPSGLWKPTASKSR